MNQSESIKLLSAALVKFQGMITAVPKDSTNPFFKMKYASLGSIMEHIRTPMLKCGLAVTQGGESLTDGHIVIETTLMHESGEFVSTLLPIKPKSDDPQGMGSAITYARRYGISAILGIVADEDDDAETDKAKAAKAEPRKVPAGWQKIENPGGVEPPPVKSVEGSTIAGVPVVLSDKLKDTKPTNAAPVSTQAVIDMALSQKYPNEVVAAIIRGIFGVEKLADIPAVGRAELLEILKEGKFKDGKVVVRPTRKGSTKTE